MNPARLRELFPQASAAFVAANAESVRVVAKAAPAPRPRKPATRRRVALTRNGGTWSEARYWAHVRSALRRAFRFWKPIQTALRAARTAAPGPRGRKWLYLCARCGALRLRRDVQVDHVVPCGALTAPKHVAGFLLALTAERPDAYQVLCRCCHADKTKREL